MVIQGLPALLNFNQDRGTIMLIAGAVIVIAGLLTQSRALRAAGNAA
jgi:hypothetical protein